LPEPTSSTCSTLRPYKRSGETSPNDWIAPERCLKGSPASGAIASSPTLRPSRSERPRSNGRSRSPSPRLTMPCM